MPKILDVIASAGEYTDAEGQQKTRWIKCGMIIKNSDTGKMSMKLDCIPVGKAQQEGDHGIWFALTEPKPFVPQQPAAPQYAPAPAAPPVPPAGPSEPDIPF